jgi:protein-S-isoprenylcysteine O-methyltransferase Ste14
MKRVRAALMLAAAAGVCLPLSGCLVVSYSSQGGWWVWPGSLVVTLVLVLVWLLTRR